MKEADSFRKIYCLSIDESTGSAILHENSADAKVRNLQIDGNGVKFYRLEECFSQQFSRDKHAHSLCAKNNSDGIILFEQEGKKYLVICELKSASGDIRKAIEQAKSSYLKLCEAFSICEPFDINSFSIVFIITAMNDGRYLSWLNKIYAAKPEDLDFFDNIALDNFEHGFFYGDSLSNPNTFSIPNEYHSSFVNREVKVLYRTTLTDTVVVNVNEF